MLPRVQCHYTKNPDERASASVSCQKCHGAASEWVDVHNNYGGKDVKKEDESPAHAKERVAKAKAAGMIRPEMLFDIASNCMGCHGFAHPNVSGDKFAKLLAAGHMMNQEYELVRYSQGQVRHRFYPYGSTTNQPMTGAELRGCL